jgi:assimilatory nitrate reductase catalytic subunit
VEPAALREFSRLFARTERAVTVFSQGVNQSSSGTDKVNAIINCHLLTGRIGKPGQGPFSVTGQPNAMGGREVGGLSGTLAAHMDFAPADRARVQAFGGSPRIAAGPGLKAVDLFEAIHDGRVRAVWIMATNPVVSLPDADRVREALRRCELVVVSDCVARTDTAELAHVLLPAAAWGEKDGTVTNSERRISRQRAFLPPAGEARPDWWIVCEVARRMGFAGFDYDGPAAIFDEHARLSAHGNAGARAFDLGALTGLTPAQYDALEPRQWPDRGRPFADGRFAHPDGRARFVPVTPRPPVHAADESFPLLLNTGRVRDQWHTMTRTGRSPRLAGHRPEPYVDLHPQDAMLSGVREHELARVATRWGAMVARVRCSGEMRRGQAFVPIHWNDQTASDARVGALVSPAVDPVSGEPEFKHTPARVEEFRVHWHGFAFARRPLRLDDVAWWARVQGRRFVRHEMAGRRPLADPAGWARRLLGVGDAGADWLDCSDPTAGVYRAALLVDDRVEACVFVSPRPDLPSRSWLSSLFDKDALDDLDRVGLLVGAPAAAGADGGAVVCSCHGVGRRTLMAAIRERELATVEEVGQCLKAGSNCGSCVPEIQSLLAEARHEEAGA